MEQKNNDPFAEYDKFWDELDHIENKGKKKIEHVDKGQMFDEDITFKDIETKQKSRNDNKKISTGGIVFLLVALSWFIPYISTNMVIIGVALMIVLVKMIKGVNRG